MLEFEDVTPLRDPMLVAAFEGWNDAGEAASAAVEHLSAVWDAEAIAALDPEDYYDFQVNRPKVLREDGQRRIVWPTTRILVARDTGFGSRDVVLVEGIEPSTRWRAFTIELLEYAQRLGVSTLVTLGALLTDVPHTRPIPVTATSDDEDVLHRLDLESSSYEGPTGIVGVIHDACRAAELRSVSLWSAVPHYVSLAPSPKAAKALCVRLADLVGVPIETAELDDAEDEYEAQVTEAVASDPDTQAYVEELERRADTIQSFSESGELPTGETLAAELTRFLRDRERRKPPGDPDED